MASLAEKSAEILAILQSFDDALPGCWVRIAQVEALHSLRLSTPVIAGHLKTMAKAGSIEMKPGAKGTAPHLFRVAQKGRGSL